MRSVAIIAAFIFTLAACGGGGGGSGSTAVGPVAPGQIPPEPRPLGPPDASNNRYAIHPGLTAADAKRSPIYRTGNLLRVGVDQGAGPERLPKTTVTGLPNVQIGYGRLNDGAGATNLQAYLSSVSGYSGLSRRLPGYEVRVIGSSTAEERARVLAAVQLVNAALPESAKLSVGAPLAGFSLKDTVNSNGKYFGASRELPNTVHIEFIPDSEYHGRHREAAATSWGEYMVVSRGTFPAYAKERYGVILLAHELVHSLGIGGHVPERFDSIMEAGNGVYSRSQNKRQPASLLYPLDREAMRALYGPLRHSSSPADLGPWSGTSEHLFVSNEHGAFGVARRNGYVEPWAHGAVPATDLAANRRLSGSATWDGVLVGFTPEAERVAGTAGIAVNLVNMGGTAAFTDLATIGDGGSLTQWSDGDLRYTIAVRGNTFRETGGDAGRLTGIFAGRSHEAAGGTLERADLSAAFGTVR